MVAFGILASCISLIVVTAAAQANDSDGVAAGGDTVAKSLAIPAIAIVIHMITMTPIDPFLDNHVMSVLPPHQRGEWGASRSFGAYGWGFGALLASKLISAVGWPSVAVQYVCGRVGTVVGFTCARPYAGSNEGNSLRYVEVLKFVVNNRRLALFLLCACCMGMGYVLVSTFLFLYLKELGAPDILFGISIATTVSTEIPLFQFAPRLHARFTNRQLFFTAAISWALRVTGYTYLTNPWMVLFLEPLHGLGFGLMWLVGVNTVSKAFPPSLTASGFGFLFASVFGVGPMLGNVVGGQLYEHLGARTMFRCAPVFMATMAMLYRYADMALEAHEEVMASTTVTVASTSETAAVSLPFPELN